MMHAERIARAMLAALVVAGWGVTIAQAAPKTENKSGTGGVVIDDLDQARELGMALPKKDDSTARMLIDFSHTRNQFAKATLIACSHGRVGELVTLVAKMGDRRLAAGVLAADAMANSFFGEIEATTLYKNIEEARARSGQDPADDTAKGKKGKKSGKGFKHESGRKSANAELLATLLRDTDADTVRLALMAAAYSGDESVKAAVSAVPVTTATTAGGVLLYKARAGDHLADDQSAALFTQAMKAPASGAAGGGMSEFSLEIPGGVMACQAAGLCKGTNLLPLLHAALASPDPRIQAEAARALAAIGSPASVPVLLQKLADCPWPVLVEVTRALGAIPDGRSITPLIMRLKGEHGRFRLDLIYALSSIVGEQKGRTAEDWESWWRKMGQTFTPDPAVTQAFRQKNRVQDMSVPLLGTFYSLPIYSERICFVVDSSQSMRGDRIKSLRANLTKAIETAADNVSFNIVNFGGVIEVFRRGSLVKDKRGAYRRIEEMDHTTGTRSYDAMEVGCRMEDVDTIYFLSDGKPTPSEVSEWSEIRRAVALCDRQRPVAFYVVEFNPEGFTEPMVNMADENYGLYEAVTITGLPEEMDTAPMKDTGSKKKTGGGAAKPAAGKGGGKKR